MTPRFVAGFGCRQGCPVETLVALLERTLAQHGLRREALVGIASVDRKAAEPGLQALATRLALPLCTFSALALAPFDEGLTHRSEMSYRHTGCYGVAESSALAMSVHSGLAASSPGRLIVPRTVFEGATLALATCA